MNHVGFVGLGRMGMLMARRLLLHNYSLVAFDLVPERAAEIQASGAVTATSIAELATLSDTVFLMLLDYQQIQDVAFQPDGLLENMRPGSTIIVTSTIAPSDISALAEAAARKKIRVVDAPVSGGLEGAADGSLVVMAACEEDVFASVEPVLRAVGSNTIRVGVVPGMGQTVKAINQMLVSIHMAAASETLVLAAKSGVDQNLLRSIIEKSMGTSRMFEARADQMLNRDFTAKGALRLNVKDMQIALRLGRERGAPLPLTTVTAQLFDKAVNQGLADEDLCAIIKVYEAQE